MLSGLDVTNFTVFSRADLTFAPHLNLIVGENGSGKSHILKLAYAISHAMARGSKESGASTPTKTYLETAIARKLRGVFRPDELGRLAHRQRGISRCEVDAGFKKGKASLRFSFNSRSKTEVTVAATPGEWVGVAPVFLPTRELLSIYPGFVSLYETSELPFEETWRDTCIFLGSPLAKGSRAAEVKELLEPLEKQLGGRADLVDGRFYLTLPTGNIEAHLVAEGLRKLAMIARLIANGSLTRTGSLFWDEPEANLNPKTIKQVARTILQLSRLGIQVFAATHSLFLMRELDILLKGSEFPAVKARFFGLHPGANGVEVAQGKSIDDVGSIDALQEELSQSDRYLAADAD